MDRSEFISGNRIFETCHSLGIPYAKTDYISDIGVRPVMVTHNGGYNVMDAPEGMVAITSVGMATFLAMPTVVRWFCQNNESNRHQTTGLPLGLENWEVKREHIGNKNYTIGSGEDKNSGLEIVKAIESQRRPGPKKSPTAMLCWRTDTAPYERALAHITLAPQPWCKWYAADIGNSDRLSPSDYIHALASHRFAVCPDGNGIDCHRVWESLYVGTCPIVKRRRVWERFSKDYPIWIVDDWREVSRANMDARWRWFERARVECSAHLSMRRIGNMLKDAMECAID